MVVVVVEVVEVGVVVEVEVAHHNMKLVNGHVVVYRAYSAGVWFVLWGAVLSNNIFCSLVYLMKFGP